MPADEAGVRHVRLPELGRLELLQTLHPDAVSVSAKTCLGLDELCRRVTQYYRGRDVVVRVLSSQANGKVQSFLRAHGQILSEQYIDSSVLIDARMGQKQLHELERLHPDRLEVIQG